MQFLLDSCLILFSVNLVDLIINSYLCVRSQQYHELGLAWHGKSNLETWNTNIASAGLLSCTMFKTSKMFAITLLFLFLILFQ